MTQSADTEALVRFLVTSLVENPDSVDIAKRVSGDSVAYEISLHPDDVGKVIGRQGRIIKAIRTLARASAGTTGEHVDVEVLG
ncbi:MAG: KH domain-containing protein [Coriobacteriia bacterium]|nr:KH domain-containing protein [Coriobacteriia bacterium]